MSLATNVFVILALSQVPASAQRTGFEDEEISMPGLDVESAAGWDGMADSSTAVPIAFMFNNVSREPVEGELVLSDPWGNHERVLDEIYLTSGQKRRFATIQDLTGWNRCVISIRRRSGTVMFRRELPISMGAGIADTDSAALIINDSPLKLQLVDTGVKFRNQPNKNNRIYHGFDSHEKPQVFQAEGRVVRSINVATWQIPDHPAPMQHATAIIIPDGVETFQINNGQWGAMARFVCSGGSIFISSTAKHIHEKLTSQSPLLPNPAVRRSPFDVQEMGLGKIYRYSGTLFGEVTEVDRQVSREVSKQIFDHQASLLKLPYSHNRESGRADMNRLLVGSFFGLYAMLSGVGTLIMFRKPRKRIIAYIGTVVIGACVIAVALGGTMRMSRGDVHWGSVIEGGAGGVVELAKIDVRSAGNRNSRLRVTGSNPDLQVMGRPRRYYYYQDDLQALPPFTKQPNLAKGESGAYEIAFTITPWGQRHLRATSYDPDIRPADLELTRRGNKWKFTLTNHLPFALIDCRLYVSAIDEDGNIWRASQSLENIDSKGSRELSFNQTARHKYDNDFQVNAPSGLLYPNRSQLKGTIRAWIAARLNGPRQLQISGDSDFVSTESAHFYVQDVAPENIVVVK